jgi:hypothetical protein
MKLILQGSLLTPPALSSSLVTGIMLKCWRREARDRIKFPEIIQLLRNSATQSQRVLNQADLPLPPAAINPVQIYDQEQYLLPIAMPPSEYLETLPDH